MDYLGISYSKHVIFKYYMLTIEKRNREKDMKFICNPSYTFLKFLPTVP